MPPIGHFWGQHPEAPLLLIPSGPLLDWMDTHPRQKLNHWWIKIGTHTNNKGFEIITIAWPYHSVMMDEVEGEDRWKNPFVFLSMHWLGSKSHLEWQKTVIIYHIVYLHQLQMGMECEGGLAWHGMQRCNNEMSKIHLIASSKKIASRYTSVLYRG